MFSDNPNKLSPNDQLCIDRCRDLCLERIKNIVPHHCGNHQKCDVAHCGYLKIKMKLKANHKRTGEAFTREDIDKRYAKESRFQGKYMSMDDASMEKVTKAITSRIDSSNVDRIARVMSSNLCENYFSVMVKFSQGKRLNLGQSNSWAVLAHFVAGLRSNPDFSTQVMERFGINKSDVRIKVQTQFAKRREYWKEWKQSDKYREQRHIRKVVSSAIMGKEAAKSSAHRSGKLNPKDACQAGSLTGQRGKNKRTCSNCHEPGHTVENCMEPHYKLPKPNGRQKKKVKTTVESMLLLFPKQSTK
jgi:hypothetical protein